MHHKIHRIQRLIAFLIVLNLAFPVPTFAMRSMSGESAVSTTGLEERLLGNSRTTQDLRLPAALAAAGMEESASVWGGVRLNQILPKLNEWLLKMNYLEPSTVPEQRRRRYFEARISPKVRYGDLAKIESTSHGTVNGPTLRHVILLPRQRRTPKDLVWSVIKGLHAAQKIDYYRQRKLEEDLSLYLQREFKQLSFPSAGLEEAREERVGEFVARYKEILNNRLVQRDFEYARSNASRWGVSREEMESKIAQLAADGPSIRIINTNRSIDRNWVLVREALEALDRLWYRMPAVARHYREEIHPLIERTLSGLPSGQSTGLEEEAYRIDWNDALKIQKTISVKAVDGDLFLLGSTPGDWYLIKVEHAGVAVFQAPAPVNKPNRIAMPLEDWWGAAREEGVNLEVSRQALGLGNHRVVRGPTGLQIVPAHKRKVDPQLVPVKLISPYGPSAAGMEENSLTPPDWGTITFGGYVEWFLTRYLQEISDAGIALFSLQIGEWKIAVDTELLKLSPLKQQYQREQILIDLSESGFEIDEPAWRQVEPLQVFVEQTSSSPQQTVLLRRLETPSGLEELDPQRAKERLTDLLWGRRRNQMLSVQLEGFPTNQVSVTLGPVGPAMIRPGLELILDSLPPTSRLSWEPSEDGKQLTLRVASLPKAFNKAKTLSALREGARSRVQAIVNQKAGLVQLLEPSMMAEYSSDHRKLLSALAELSESRIILLPEDRETAADQIMSVSGEATIKHQGSRDDLERLQSTMESRRAVRLPSRAWTFYGGPTDLDGQVKSLLRNIYLGIPHEDFPWPAGDTGNMVPALLNDLRLLAGSSTGLEERYPVVVWGQPGQPPRIVWERGSGNRLPDASDLPADLVIVTQAGLFPTEVVDRLKGLADSRNGQLVILPDALTDRGLLGYLSEWDRPVLAVVDERFATALEELPETRRNRITAVLVNPGDVPSRPVQWWYSQIVQILRTGGFVRLSPALQSGMEEMALLENL